MKGIQIVLGLVAIVTTPNNVFVICSSYANAASVFNDIMANYTKELRPIRNQSLPVIISVQPILRSVNSYEEITATLSLILGFSMIWRDEIIKWDPIQYGGIKDLVIPQNNVWKPELFLMDTADKMVPISNAAFKVHIFHNGTVNWFTGDGMKATCSPNMRYFPFDTQTCILRYGVWGFSTAKVLLTTDKSNLDLSQFVKNGAWDLKKASSEAFNDGYPTAVLQITIGLNRKSLYYTITLIIPILSLCLLNPVVFTLPYSSGERVSFCTTVLLSFAVYMTITGNVIPRVSEPFPLLLVFLFIIQAFSGVVLTVNGFICRAYNKGDRDDVPLMIRKIVRLWAKARTCCYCGNSKSSVYPDNTSEIEKNNIDMADSEHDDKNSNRYCDILSWSTVAKAFDQICFLMSYIVIVVVTLFFILSAILGSP